MTRWRILGREATIARHLRALKAMLNWAKDMGMLAEVPKIRMPQRVRGGKVMSGRPITEAEFQRMLDAV